ncbi:hypothetical protein AAV97_04940 [Acinetobacter sp. Ag2]|uniref:tape measure protein n=1 Tax=Acinetobacter sp. Ag2 TaxID=1646532 RepID=UPI000629A06A|nr:tape measure protein [Acinetobacter sp. Ag2]KKW80363.1 hypothetical protein AAV97_04940 [Acinetobacter sp. Ag2]
MTEQTSRLVIEISSEQAKKNAEDLSKELVKIFTGGEKASDSTSKLGKTIQVTSNITQNFNTTVNNTTKALSDQEKQVNQNGLAIKEMAKFVAGYISISKGIAAADNYTQMAARIRNTTSSAQEYNLVQERLLVTANTTFRALNEAQEVYLSLAGGMKSLGYSTKQTLDLSDSLSFAFTANATRADQAQSAMDALSKSMAKGTIDADAWISIVTGADNIIADMAKTTGKTESEIRQLGATGKASLEDLIKTLVATREQNEKLANNMENSFKDGLQKLTNETTVFLGKLNETTKLTGTLATGLGFLGEHVDKLAVLGGIAASIYGGRLVAAFVETSIKAGWATAAIVTQTGATTALTTAIRGLSLASGVGLVVGIAGAAASMLLLSRDTEVATKSLNEQGISIDEIIKKYNDLDEAQKRTQLRAETASLEDLTKQYQDAETKLITLTLQLYRSGDASENVAKIISKLAMQYKQGDMSANDLAFRINNLNGVTAEGKAKVDAQASSITKLKNELLTQKDVTEQMIEVSGRSTKASEAETKAINDKRIAQQRLNELQKSYAQKNLDTDFSLINIKSHGLEKGKALSDFYDNNKIPKTRSLTNEEWAVFQKYFDKQQALKKLEDDITESKRQQTKETENLIKTQQRLIGISGNSGIGTGAHLDVRYGGSRDGQKVSPEHIARLQAGGKSLSSYRVSSDYGQRKAPTAGASSFHKGIDFAMPVGTPITTKVAVKDVKTAYDSKGGGYYSTITFEDGVVLKLLHQSPSMQSKVKGGASTGNYGSYLAQDKAEAKTEKEIETLKANYYSLGEKDEADHIKRVKDLRKNGLDSLIAEENTRFEKTKQLRQFEFTMEVDGWRWVGEEKIKNDAYVKKLRVEASADLNKKQKTESIKSIDEQREYELEQFRLTKQQQLLQTKAFYMSELQLAKAKYDIEKRLIAQSNEDPAEKAFKTQMLELQNQVDMNRRLKDASMGWDSVRSQMDGSSARYQVGQERFNRMDVSQNLFDIQIADVERQEQEPGADLEKLAEVREQIWAAHNQRMIDIENQYQKDSLNLQLTQAQQLTGSFANMFRGILGESSGAYKTMFAMQQGFALTQAGMNLWSSVSDAYAKEPGTVWQKVAAGAKAALDQGTFLTMIQAITPQGFATGGHITGKGTGTSDDIPIMASNGEFMIRQAAVSKLGLVALNYMNKTGELPFQSEFNAAKYQFSLPNKQPTEKFRDGGLIGVSRMSNADVERKQFESIQRSNSISAQPKVTIINQTSQPVEATSQWDGNELHVVLREMQKLNETKTKSLIAQSWRDAERQGGALDRIKKGR